MLEWHRTLLHLRRERPALHRGSLRLLAGSGDGIVAYERSHEDDLVTVVVNTGAASATVPVSADALLAASAEDVTFHDGLLRLPSDRAAVLG